MDPKFPSYWKPYVLQSSYAAGTVFFITLLLSENPVVIASIGATAFIVFALPNNISAEPKRIIGGHFLGFFIGSCFAVFPFMPYFLKQFGLLCPLVLLSSLWLFWILSILLLQEQH